MSAVDWLQVSHNPLISYHYKCKNRYDALLDDNDVKSDYKHQMESITGTALEFLPKKKKKRKENPYKDPIIEHHGNIL